MITIHIDLETGIIMLELDDDENIDHNSEIAEEFVNAINDIYLKAVGSGEQMH